MGTRAIKLKVKLLLAQKSIKWAAEQLGVSREWLTKVLNDKEQSEGLLDRLEELIDSLDGMIVLA